MTYKPSVATTVLTIQLGLSAIAFATGSLSRQTGKGQSSFLPARIQDRNFQLTAGPENALVLPLGSTSLLQPISRDPDTQIYGVNPEQVRTIVRTLKDYYGDDLVDLAVTNSRASGKMRGLRGGGPAHIYSDLDLVPLLRSSREGRGPSSSHIAAILTKLVGIQVELHPVISFDGKPFKDGVPFHGHGEEEFHYLPQPGAPGTAVQIDLDKYSD